MVRKSTLAANWSHVGCHVGCDLEGLGHGMVVGSSLCMSASYSDDQALASYPVLFLDSPPERGEEKRAWYTLTAHVQDLHPLAQDPWATGCTGSALGLYVPKAKTSQEL